jgi:hypothetical protein
MTQTTVANMSSKSANKKSECLEFIKQCNEKYIFNLNFVPPEQIMNFIYKRSPCVIMYKMVEELPEGEEFDKYAVELAELAHLSVSVSVLDILELWWIPVATHGLHDIIGKNDTSWKQSLINIWMNSEITQIDIP